MSTSGVGKPTGIGSKDATHLNGTRRMQPFTAMPFSYRLDPDVPSFSDAHPIIVFDGKCALCSGFVRFVLRRDRRERFRFVAAQSALGQAIYRHYRLDAINYETNLLLWGGRIYMKSGGSLRMFEMLGFPFSLLALGRLLPRFARDWLYDIIARHRLEWFGSHDTCMLPEPRFAHRFLG